MVLALQPAEADALEAMLDLILTNEAACKAVLPDGDQRRSVARVSLKLHWAKGRTELA